LALRLRQYGIASKQIRGGTSNKKGYLRADLADAWARYLPSPQTSETSETAETTQHFQAPKVSAVSDSHQDVSDEALDVSDTQPDASLNGGSKKPTRSKTVSDVSDVSLLADHGGRTSNVVNGRDATEDQPDDIPADRTCAQCQGEIDGTERPVSVSGRAVWLHDVCERIWVRALDEATVR
jgi:hypothetical protein